MIGIECSRWKFGRRKICWRWAGERFSISVCADSDSENWPCRMLLEGALEDVVISNSVLRLLTRWKLKWVSPVGLGPSWSRSRSNSSSTSNQIKMDLVKSTQWFSVEELWMWAPAKTVKQSARLRREICGIFWRVLERPDLEGFVEEEEPRAIRCEAGKNWKLENLWKLISGKFSLVGKSVGVKNEPCEKCAAHRKKRER